MCLEPLKFFTLRVQHRRHLESIHLWSSLDCNHLMCASWSPAASARDSRARDQRSWQIRYTRTDTRTVSKRRKRKKRNEGSPSRYPPPVGRFSGRSVLVICALLHFLHSGTTIAFDSGSEWHNSRVSGKRSRQSHSPNSTTVQHPVPGTRRDIYLSTQLHNPFERSLVPRP